MCVGGEMTFKCHTKTKTKKRNNNTLAHTSCPPKDKIGLRYIFVFSVQQLWNERWSLSLRREFNRLKRQVDEY